MAFKHGNAEIIDSTDPPMLSRLRNLIGSRWHTAIQAAPALSMQKAAALAVRCQEYQL